MTTRFLPRELRPITIAAGLACGIVLLVGLFVGTLEMMETREEARLDAERQADPARYLDELRTRQGMGAYLQALAELRDFDQWRQQAPTVLTGAWALVDSRRSAEAGEPGRHCLSGLVIEDGQVRYFGERTGSIEARYRIDGRQVLVELAEGGTITLSPAPDPRHQHELAVTLPEDPAGRYYGYRCVVY